MRDWQRWLITLIFGAAAGSGILPQFVTPTPDNPSGLVQGTNTAPTANPSSTILGALIGAGVAATALKTQLDSTKRK